MAATISWRKTDTDLQFYKDDLRFLYHLIDKYFWGTLNANLDEMRELAALLTRARLRCINRKDSI
jgi:hypothetical protein